jgi:holin-like protein
MLRKTSILMQRNRWLQAGWLFGIWWICETVVHALALPIPGGVLGMAVLLALLLSGRLRTIWLRRGTTGFLDHMVLFFVPAIMALLNHRELLSMLGVKILVVIVVGTVLVMTGTALVVDFCMRWSVAPDEH